MPIYKMQGKKDGLQKYRMRIHFVDQKGEPKQVDRVACGTDNAKLLELQLTQSIKQEQPAKKMTVTELFDEYMQVKQHEVRETTLDKDKRILEFHILPFLAAVKIDKLTLPVFQQWKNTMQEKIHSLHCVPCSIMR